jgi:hypothetical protein
LFEGHLSHLDKFVQSGGHIIFFFLSQQFSMDISYSAADRKQTFRLAHATPGPVLRNRGLI